MTRRVPQHFAVRNAFIPGTPTTPGTGNTSGSIPVTYPTDFSIYPYSSEEGVTLPFLYAPPLYPHQNQAVKFYNVLNSSASTQMRVSLWAARNVGIQGLSFAISEEDTDTLVFSQDVSLLGFASYAVELKSPISQLLEDGPLTPLLLSISFTNLGDGLITPLGPICTLGSITTLDAANSSVTATLLEQLPG